MTSVYRGSVIDSLERLFTAGTASPLSDTQLLERFLTRGDSAAFDAMLERHGPIVFRVCRRMLNDPNDVDDAFQATFLILVKNASSIRDKSALGMWLYGVARRVAVRARVNARRRRLCEKSCAEGLSVKRPNGDQHDTIELRALLDDELARLPYRYRAPLVLCDVEGWTHERAAVELNCPIGTVKSRLSRGRERLRARLLRRGVMATATLTSIAAPDQASASSELLTKTFHAANKLVVAKGAAAGLVTARVSSLIEAVMRSMLASKLKLATAAVAVIALLVTGIEKFIFPAASRPALPAQETRDPAPGPLAAGPSIEKQSKKPEPGSERFVLANGLTVILRPIKGPDSTALIVLYSIGNDHDPPGKSGLAHLLEHVYVTAAAGETPARTVEEFVSRYAAGANGQTGDRYTVFAAVFPKNDLERELKDAAARMRDLRLTADDLARERPRLLEEVDNMFSDFPQLAAVNNARELVRPTPGGGRRGGTPAQVKSFTADELQAFWNRYYKPRNAILALSGAVEPAAAREWITAHFGKLAPGEAVPAPRGPGPARRREITEVKVRSPLPDAKSTACLAYAAPQCGSESYAPFLVLIARLWAGANKLGDGGPTGSSVYFTPLDDGAVVALSTTAKPGETSAGAFSRIEAFVAETIEPKLRPFELMMARQQFGGLLGLVTLPDSILTNNPYGVAFSLGRRDQLNISSAELRRAWDAVTDEQLRRVANQFFAPECHAGAFIEVQN